MSAMVVSGSCPMPVTTGTGQAEIARARPSSLKGIKLSNEPPPRKSRITSTPESQTSCKASVISRAAVGPSTGTPATTMRAKGKRRRKVRRASCTTAPFGEVTIPTVRGIRGIGRLRDASMSPSAFSFSANWATCWRRAPSPASLIP